MTHDETTLVQRSGKIYKFGKDVGWFWEYAENGIKWRSGYTFTKWGACRQLKRAKNKPIGEWDVEIIEL